MNPPTLAEFNAIIAQCGCCEHPRCCPPQLQCRSIVAEAVNTGFDLPDSGSEDSDALPLWQRTKYLKEVRTLIPDPDETTYDTYPAGGSGGGGTYVDYSRVDSRDIRQINQASRAFVASICNITTPAVSYDFVCEIAGTITRSYYQNYREDIVGEESIGANANFLSATEVDTWSSIAGERTAEHIEWEAEAAAWDTEHTDYAGEIVTYESALAIWQADYDAWEIDWNEWNDGGQIGTEPTFDDPMPTLADPRPEEPAEFYGPCMVRITTVRTAWERVNLGEGWIIRLVPEDSEYENPLTTESITGPVSVSGDPTYEQPVTLAEYIALVEAWVAENAPIAFTNSELSESDSDYCAASTTCGAYKFHAADIASPWRAAVYNQVFQYRWKLNKCCGYTSITSGWREVYWPQVYLEWLAEIELLGSDDVIPPPPVDLDALAAKKQWLWTGTPPLCIDSDSLDSDAPPVDSFDHEPMHSPWSSIIDIPSGEQGRKALRNYFQICHGPLKDFMPEVTGEVDFSDDLPDEFV